MLARTTEITLTDSLSISGLDKEMVKLDSNTVKQWFTPVFSSSQSIKFKKRDYYLAGKITGSQHFDLLVLVEDKRRGDSSGYKVIHLVTTKKDGSYIASLKAAVSGTKKQSNYNTSAWLYKGLNIIQYSKIITSTTSMANITNYRINNTGRFLMYNN